MKKALVIVGNQGSGKTTTARDIAQGRGGFISVLGSEVFKRNFWASQAGVNKHIKTIIIEDMTDSANEWNNLKSLVTSSKMRIDRQGEHPFIIDTPSIIVTSLFRPPIDISVDRNFNILTIHS